MHFNNHRSRPCERPAAESIVTRVGFYWGRVVAWLVAAVFLADSAHPGQLTAPGMLIKPAPQTPQASQIPDANAQMRMREERAKQQDFAAANAERKKQIADDSSKLLKLAVDLKAEIDETTKDTPSPHAIHSAGEIERLAHDVKEKMKLTVGAN